MPDEARGRYLAALDALLPMPAEQRVEVIEEIAAHLDDAVTDRIEHGSPPDRAEADAQARLGTPLELARDLARPGQSTGRVFAGVGAALWSGVGHWIYGYLFGLLVVLLGALALGAAVQAFGTIFGTGWTLMFTDQGWNTTLTALAAGSGLYFAGRVLPDRFGRASQRLTADVRPWVVGVSTLAVLAFSTLIVDAPQNWASVAALSLAPAGLVVGAYRPDLLPGRIRFSIAAILVGFLLVGIVGIGLVGTGSGTSGNPQEIEELPDRGLAIVGPEWHPNADEPFLGALTSSNAGGGGEMGAWTGEITPGVSLGGFRDVRIEAWRALEISMQLDPAYREPFATAPVTRTGRSLSAVIDTTGEPGVVFWELILTGVADDGVRYVLDASTGGQSTFTGSVWDWLQAVADR